MSDILIINTRSNTGELMRLSLERHGLSVFVVEAPSAYKDLPGYLRAVRKGLADSGAGTMIPIFYSEVLASMRDGFPSIRILAGDASKIILLDNKRTAAELAESLGIPCPMLYQAGNSQADSAVTDTVLKHPLKLDYIQKYPVVFKRALGQGGDSVYFPKNRKALENLIATADDYLITEFIEGENVSVDCLRWNGYFRAACYHVLEPRGKGISTLRESFQSPLLAEYAKRILDAVDYNGVCGMDFRLDSKGDLYFLECNPRFSGGLETTLASGFDLPFEYYSRFIADSPNG